MGGKPDDGSELNGRPAAFAHRTAVWRAAAWHPAPLGQVVQRHFAPLARKEVGQRRKGGADFHAFAGLRAS